MRIGGIVSFVVGSLAALLSGVAVDRIANQTSWSVGVAGSVFALCAMITGFIARKHTPASDSPRPLEKHARHLDAHLPFEVKRPDVAVELSEVRMKVSRHAYSLGLRIDLLNSDYPDPIRVDYEINVAHLDQNGAVIWWSRLRTYGEFEAETGYKASFQARCRIGHAGYRTRELRRTRALQVVLDLGVPEKRGNRYWKKDLPGMELTHEQITVGPIPVTPLWRLFIRNY